MIRRPPRSTRTDTLFPYTTLFRSVPAWLLRADSPLRFRPRLDPHQWWWRTEDHTSELPSLMRLSYAVFSLKKKTTPAPPMQITDGLHLDNNTATCYTTIECTSWCSHSSGHTSSLTKLKLTTK